MIHACITGGKVVNVLVADQAFIDAGHIADQYDSFVDITDMSPMPGVGWDYDGSAFHDNRYVAPTLTQKIDASLEAAQIFGDKLSNQFMNENVQLGISVVSGGAQVKPVADYCHWLSHYLGSGSLRAAITQLGIMIADTSDTKTGLAPYITNDRLTAYLNYINVYLGLPTV